MAKQLVNPVERHIEKAVLGLAVLLLLGVIARFLITSPNQVELGGEMVTPATVDQRIMQAANSTRERIRRASPEVDLPEPLYEQWLAQLDPFSAEEIELSLPGRVAIGPDVPTIDAPESKAGQAELVAVVGLESPTLVFGRSTYVIDVGDRDPLYIPANWVTLSATFDVKNEMADQGRMYGPSRKDVIFGRTELQRRTPREDGSWSEDDWMDIKTYPSLETPTQPQIELLQDQDRWDVSEETLEDIEGFFVEQSDSYLQLDLLRPLLPEFVNGEEWKFPVLTTYRDVLMQDDQFLYPDDPPAPVPEDRYGPGSLRRVTVELTPEEELAATFSEIQKLMVGAEQFTNENDAILAYNLANGIEDDRTNPEGDRAKATKLKLAAEQLMADIRRRNRLGRPTGRGEVATADEEKARQPLPIQQLWVHDAEPGSVESGKTYQYRFRPVIYNRLAGQAAKLKNPDDAAKLFIAGQWSDPLDVTIAPTGVFFITSKDPRKGRVGVEFYQWFEGIWTKSPKRLKFGEGDPIRGEARCQVPSLDDPTKADNARVVFEVDASVVDIDFNAPFRERKRGSGRTGVKFTSMSTACSVVLVDGDGRLDERFLPTEKNHPAKRDYEGMKWSAPKQGD